MNYMVASASAVLILWMAGTVAAQPGLTGADVCKKMIAGGRGGNLTQKDCICAYRVAETVLDTDLQVLLFDS